MCSVRGILSYVGFLIFTDGAQKKKKLDFFFFANITGDGISGDKFQHKTLDISYYLSFKD